MPEYRGDLLSLNFQCKPPVSIAMNTQRLKEKSLSCRRYLQQKIFPDRKKKKKNTSKDFEKVITLKQKWLVTYLHRAGLQ